MSQQGPQTKKHKSNAHEQKTSFATKWYIKFQGPDNYLVENITDLDRIDQAIALGAKVNPKSPEDISPLLQAIEKNAALSVKKLIKAGADVNLAGKYIMDQTHSTSMLPIIKALDQGNVKIVHYLLKSKAKVDFIYAIKNAVMQGNIALTEELIQSIADEEEVLLVNKLTPAIEFAMNNRKSQAFELLLQYYPCKEQFLHKALIERNTELLKTLSDLNVNLNQSLYFAEFNENLTPLAYFMRKNDVEMVSVLILDLGVDHSEADRNKFLVEFYCIDDNQKALNFSKLIKPILQVLEIDGEFKLPLLGFLNLEHCIHLPKDLLLLLLNDPVQFINTFSQSELSYVFKTASLKAREILHMSRAVEREHIKNQTILANNDESAMYDDHKLFKHFTQIIKPHYRDEFKNRGGVQGVETEIRRMLLRKIKKDANLPIFVKEIIEQNFDTLILGEQENVMELIRQFFNSNTDSNQIAWRLYDKGAPFIGDRNFATESDSEDSRFLREMLAYYFIAVTDGNIQPEFKKDRVSNFILQLGEIRRGNNKDNPTLGLDNVSCYTGYLSRIGQMGIQHEILEIPELPLEEIVRNLVTAKFNECLSNIPVHDDIARNKLFEALVTLQESNARDVISGEVPFSDEMFSIRKAFAQEVLGERFADTYSKVEDQLRSYVHSDDYIREMEKPINRLKLQLYRLDISRGTIGDTLTELYNPYREYAITLEKVEAVLKYILVKGIHEPQLRPIIHNYLDATQKTPEILVAFFKEIFDKADLINDDLKQTLKINLNNDDLLQVITPICHNNIDYLVRYSNRHLGSETQLISNLEDVFAKRAMQMLHYPDALKKSQTEKLKAQQKRCKALANSLCTICPSELIKYQTINLKDAIVDFVDYTTNNPIEELDVRYWHNFYAKHPIMNQLGMEAKEILTNPISQFKRAYY